MLEVIWLGILQGIAEFLPISSSGHLALGKHFLGLGEVGMRLDIFLHVGTLLAVFAFYWSRIWQILKSWDWKYMLLIVLSAVPVGIVGVIFKDDIEILGKKPVFVALALIFTGLVLTIQRFLPKGDREVGWWGSLWMGLAQAIAILPGVSRSGMTISAGRTFRVSPERCAEFSFLMSAPPIAGAALLDLLECAKATEVAAGAEIGWSLVALGGAISAVVGYLSLKLLVRSLQGKWFWLFGPYCLAAGLLTLILV